MTNGTAEQGGGVKEAIVTYLSPAYAILLRIENWFVEHCDFAYDTSVKNGKAVSAKQVFFGCFNLGQRHEQFLAITWRNSNKCNFQQFFGWITFEKLAVLGIGMESWTICKEACCWVKHKLRLNKINF